MPVKSKVGAYKGKTPKEKGYFEGSFGEWIRLNNEMFRGKTFIIGDTLYFERADYKSALTSYQLPDVKREFHAINSDQFYATTLIEFQLDTMDTNTVTEIDGTNLKAVVSHINQGADGTEILKGFIQHRPACALGRRKNELTEIEEAFKDLFTGLQVIIDAILTVANTINTVVEVTVKAINKLIKAVNTLPGINLSKLDTPTINIPAINFAGDIANAFKDRIGMLSLSSDFTSVPKAVLTESASGGVKIPANAQTKLSAETIFNYYYYIDNFVPSLGKKTGKQQYIWRISNVPFCKEDFEVVRGIMDTKPGSGEAKVISPEGNEVEIVSILWNIWKDTADIVYAENKIFDDNLTLTTTKNTGA
jgi:hypothetical protein